MCKHLHWDKRYWAESRAQRQTQEANYWATALTKTECFPSRPCLFRPDAYKNSDVQYFKRHFYRLNSQTVSDRSAIVYTAKLFFTGKCNIKCRQAIRLHRESNTVRPFECHWLHRISVTGTTDSASTYCVSLLMCPRTNVKCQCICLYTFIWGSVGSFLSPPPRPVHASFSSLLCITAPRTIAGMPSDANSCSDIVAEMQNSTWLFSLLCLPLGTVSGSYWGFLRGRVLLPEAAIITLSQRFLWMNRDMKKRRSQRNID